MVAGYAESTPRKVPSFADLHRMAALLLAERAPETADILVLGAGGGLELRAFAEARADWRFVGVDPSAEMLDLARRVLGPPQPRVELQQGYAHTAPPALSTRLSPAWTWLRPHPRNVLSAVAPATTLNFWPCD